MLVHFVLLAGVRGALFDISLYSTPPTRGAHSRLRMAPSQVGVAGTWDALRGLKDNPLLSSVRDRTSQGLSLLRSSVEKATDCARMPAPCCHTHLL
jgi:hypothetical protein